VKNGEWRVRAHTRALGIYRAEHRPRGVGAMAPSHWRSRRASGAGPSVAAPEVGLLGPPFGWLLPTAPWMLAIGVFEFFKLSSSHN